MDKADERARELLFKIALAHHLDFDFAAADAALDHAGLTARVADGDTRLVDAEPEVVAAVAMAGGVLLRRLAPAQDTGLERLFFDLTTPENQRELAGATA